MSEIATKEPAKFYSGDTVKWTRSLTDYPAGDGWTLNYSFRRQGGEGAAVAFTSTADGNNHLIELTPVVTETYIAGVYRGVGYVVNGDESERYTVWTGDIEILPNLALAAPEHDGRTKAERILDFIDRSFERVAAKQVVSSSIEGVNLQFRSYDDLIKARNYWAAVVATEKAAGANNGRSRYIFARFTAPT